MKITTKLLAPIAIGFAVVLSASSLKAELGQWDFNTGNLTATVGATLGDLTFSDGGGGATDLGTQFGTTTGFGIPDIGGTPANVMKFPAATNGMGYSMPTPGPNGGGTVNQYTIIYDVLYPSASDAKIRPLVQTEDGSHLGSQQYLGVVADNAVGAFSVGPSGLNNPGVGSVQPNTWYRIGLVVKAGVNTVVYVNGAVAGSFPAGVVDGFLALNPSATALILGTASTNAATGYVNSIQLRDVALSGGQMLALGTASAAGIPQTIPPVPSFIASRTPDVGAIGVAPSPAITNILDQGDTTITGGSIKLKLDGALVPATVTPSVPTYTITYTVPTRLDPNSVHTLSLEWADNVAGNKTNSWSFTVKAYQVVNLPAPFEFEDFESLTENATNGLAGISMPIDWTVTNRSAPGNPGWSLTDRNSDTYANWVAVTKARFDTWDDQRTNMPLIILNGTPLDSMAHGNMMWAESDQRCGSCNGQFQEMYTRDFNCTGKTNVFVSWHSIYEQNQDNMNACEYSIDGGANWKPVLYLFCAQGNGETSDILYNPDGTVDAVGTFAKIEGNQNWVPPGAPIAPTNYGIYIKAPISAALVPYIKGYTNDDTFDGKRIELVRLPAADGQPTVRFRFLDTGTSAWFWGIDDLGLYEINAPVISTQPSPLIRNADSSATFNVVAVGTPAPTYQWQYNGGSGSIFSDLSGQTGSSLTFAAEPNNAGSYRVVVSNSFGVVVSSSAALTVIAQPTVISPPVAQSVNAGVDVLFSITALGRAPIAYQWTKGGSPIGGQTGTSLVLLNAQLTDAGLYACVLSNSDGAITSRVARLTIVTNITQNLVVHLKFDNNYNDSSGRGNNGTAVGSPTFAAGKIGNALQYTEPKGESATNYVTLGIPPDLHMVDSVSFSISFWYKVPVGNVDGDPAIVSNKDWDSGGNTGFVLFNSGSGLQWNYTEVNDGVSANTRKDSGGTSPAVGDGNWHHCAVIFNRGGNAGTYVDGNLVQVGTLASPNPGLGGVFPPTTIDNNPTNGRTRTATGAWNIGEDGSGLYGLHDNVGVTNAMIDDLGIWQRALTPGEVQAIYVAGNAGNDLETAAAVTNPRPLEPSVAISGVNAVVTKGATILLSAPAVTGPWTEITGARSTNVFTEPLVGSQKFYRGSQP